jgi:hypothetical protein
LTTPARVHGKRGRQPAKRLPLRFVHEYAREPLPVPSYPVDVTGGIADHEWFMLGNGPDPTCTTNPDGVGDCGFAGRQHVRMSKAACYGETETWETSDQLVAEYLAYDGGQDQGVVLADVLLAWYRDGKILAFAPVDHTNPAAVDSAMQAFKGVLTGVDLTDDAEQLFDAAQPWTVAGGQRPDGSLGHCIAKVKADGQDRDDYVTWGALQGATREWSSACVVECWVVITSEDPRIDTAALRADIDALGGTGGAPAPQPAPSPQPTPDPAVLLEQAAELIRSLAASAKKDVYEALAWLAKNNL